MIFFQKIPGLYRFRMMVQIMEELLLLSSVHKMLGKNYSDFIAFLL